MPSDKQLEDMLNNKEKINPLDGYYSDDKLQEDRTINNEYFGECINYIPETGFSITQEPTVDKVIELIESYSAHKIKHKHNPNMLAKLEIDFTKEYARLTGADYKK